MKMKMVKQAALLLVLGLATASPLFAADVNGDGVDDDSSTFVDQDGDGIHDLQSSVEAAIDVSEMDPTPTRGVVIVHKSRPLAYFGYSQASQMTPRGFQVMRSTIEWLTSSKEPADTQVILFTYDGAPNSCGGRDINGSAVHRFLQREGYDNIEFRNQREAASLPASHYNNFDIVIYWNSFGYDPAQILKSGIPFMSNSLPHSRDMGLATGERMLREVRDTTYVIDNGHPVTEPFPLGALTFAGRIRVEASQATDSGRALIVADPLHDAVSVEIDINPYSDPNLIKPLQKGKIAVSILGSAAFDTRTIDRESIDFGLDRARPTGKWGSYFKDLNDDGRADLVVRFLTQETGIAIGDTGACLNAITLDGFPIRGCDDFVTLPPSKWHIVGEN